MEEILEELDQQQDAISLKNLEEKNADRKELLQLAYIAVGEAICYINDYKRC